MNGPPNASYFTGLSLVPRPQLAGSKRAVKIGALLYVSPAMYDLLRHADEKELQLLVEKIEFVEIPEPPGFRDLPMITQPPAADHFARDITRFIRPWDL